MDAREVLVIITGAHKVKRVNSIPGSVDIKLSVD